jgi:small subunit ribosomal protein S16
MLAIRLQRTGRTGNAQFRVIVQDSRFSPKRGRVVAYLGSYDPHAKALTVDGEKTSQYLDNGAQPSDRVARLLQKEGIKLPAWVKLDEPKQRTVRNPEKRRSTRPAEPETVQTTVPAAEEAPSEPAPQTENTENEVPPAETPAEEASAQAAQPESPAAEQPAEAAAQSESEQ